MRAVANWHSVQFCVSGKPSEPIKFVIVIRCFGPTPCNAYLKRLVTFTYRPNFLNRRIFAKRILDGGPSPKQLRKWAAQQHSHTQSASLPGGAPTLDESKWGGMPLRRAVTFLDASRYIRDQTRIHETRTAFVNIRRAADGETVRLTRPGEPNRQRKPSEWHPSRLRLARVKFDAYNTLLHRCCFKQLPILLCSFYLYLDASPQLRGLECFAAAFDILCQNSLWLIAHRKFPQVALGPMVHTTLGKACALLWMIWLIVGADYDAVLAFTNAVESLCTSESSI